MATSLPHETSNLPKSKQIAGEKEPEFLYYKRTLVSLLDRNPQAWHTFFGSWRSSNHSLLTWFGLHFILTCYGSSLHTTYFFSGKLGPWEWLGLRVVCFNLGLRIFPLTNMGFSILQGGLSMRRVIPETSEVVVACQRGDLLAVQALFASRKASPYDVTRSNCGPLRVSLPVRIST